MEKVAIILGGGNTLVDDMRYVGVVLGSAGIESFTLIATNDAGSDYDGPVDHWVTLHPEKMQDWIDHRRRKGYEPASNYWTSNVKDLPPDIQFQRVPSWDGSSGLLAVTVALHLGFNKVILCGVPLDKKACHYFNKEQWMDAPRYRHAWTKRIPEMMGKVKSPSGWTASILGLPTSEWVSQ